MSETHSPEEVRLNDPLLAPFPYFGGKRHVGNLAWKLMGDPAAYVEPFAGSAAVLLARPRYGGMRREVINDLDGWITNLWRSIRDRPDDVIRHINGPIMELDLHARLAYLKEQQGPELVSWLEGDPNHCDPKIAGWWLYATIGSIAGGTRPGPWKRSAGKLVKVSGDKDGIVRSIPHLSRGRTFANVRDLTRIHERLSSVVITCGDWRRPLSKAIANSYSSVGIFLDPPYESRTRTVDGQTLYAIDGLEVSAEVRAWCAATPGQFQSARIILCGYENEHDSLAAYGWRKIDAPKSAAGGGYEASGLNGHRDRLWVSPACLKADEESPSLLDLILQSDDPRNRDGMDRQP